MLEGKESLNEVRLDVVKTEDRGSRKIFLTSSFESFGNEGEKKRTIRSSGFRLSYEWICNLMDEAGEARRDCDRCESWSFSLLNGRGKRKGVVPNGPRPFNGKMGRFFGA